MLRGSFLLHETTWGQREVGTNCETVFSMKRELYVHIFFWMLSVWWPACKIDRKTPVDKAFSGNLRGSFFQWFHVVNLKEVTKQILLHRFPQNLVIIYCYCNKHESIRGMLSRTRWQQFEEMEVWTLLPAAAHPAAQCFVTFHHAGDGTRGGNVTSISMDQVKLEWCQFIIGRERIIGHIKPSVSLPELLMVSRDRTINSTKAVKVWAGRLPLS